LLAVLAVVLFMLARMTTLLQQLGNEELGSLTDEDAIHRAAWRVEAEVRRTEDACDQGSLAEIESQSLWGAIGALEEALKTPGRAVGGQVFGVAARYLEFAQIASEAPVCAHLHDVNADRARLHLDSEMTDAWTARLLVLTRAASLREKQAQQIGIDALVVGGFSGLAAILIAAMVARNTARTIAAPVHTLSRAAQRIGDGDLNPLEPVRGPLEIESLAREFDRMRIKLAEVDVLKQGFLASVSHELRTPLGKLREALSLLKDGAAGPLGERQARIVTIASVACEREIRLVTTLLDLSRLQAGHPLQLRPGVSLANVLSDAIEGEREQATHRGVELSLSLPSPGLHGNVDAALLERAIANLVRNAISVTPSGKRVSIRCSSDSSDDLPNQSRLAISVEDEGPGVPAARRADLFNAFATFPVDGLPDRVGSGLGLALARAVARAHGGEVELLDVEKGSSFVLTIALDLPVNSPS
jgi:two-component system sensor histidine kinase GlrK